MVNSDQIVLELGKAFKKSIVNRNPTRWYSNSRFYPLPPQEFLSGHTEKLKLLQIEALLHEAKIHDWCIINNLKKRNYWIIYCIIFVFVENDPRANAEPG